MDKQKTFPLGLTFDDLLLLPDYADFSRSDIDLSTRLTKNIKLSLPFVSSPMDTVTESKLAIKIGQLGGIGIIHRNLTVLQQAQEVKAVKAKKVLVGAAVGASKGFEERASALVKAGVDVIVVDSAHGYSKGVIETIRYIKKHFPKVEVIGGSISTAEGAKALIAAGADGLRVGMGPGAICTTRIISGMGVPQMTAIFETTKIASKFNIPIIADGGIKFSGDIVKALAAGASSIMMGSYFAATIESPGKVMNLTKEQVPARFKSILKRSLKFYKFKEYRGMGSVGAMKQGEKVKAEDEFHGKEYYKKRTMVAEGVEAMVPVSGTVEEAIDQLIGGIKSGMFYTGAKTIHSLWQKAKFIQITQASLVESHPHSILITNPGKNYS
jgi:IMP dehydrogenase